VKRKCFFGAEQMSHLKKLQEIVNEWFAQGVSIKRARRLERQKKCRDSKDDWPFVLL
jgi:hypothetical protein